MNTKMKILSGPDLACCVAAKMKRPTLFISFPTNVDFSVYEHIKAAPYLSVKDRQVFHDGYAIIVCDSVKEQQKLFDLTVGDDGPTKLNKYSGSARVYALMIDAKGKTQDENT